MRNITGFLTVLGVFSLVFAGHAQTASFVGKVF